ncbi:DUF2007 domain-containing protein [Candidimonas humi]|jgi:hypothetical protein|uniref:Signal transducing protein n=1 Tax=Candidimonas humi TaxID=683355 RepID=A0ABV8NX61_9BURK|nr:DUF2007 domain-containing protein [Candidimonas humi]MBV6305940.1 DUF2007 domain-containing protein [Candidimonas humi]
MVPVYTPKSEPETAVIVALMEAYGIAYFMQGGAFGTMYPGPVSNSLNARTLMVEDDQAELARELIRPFL